MPGEWIIAGVALLLRHRTLTIAFYAVVTVGALCFASGLSFDPSWDLFLNQQTESHVRTKELEKQFGGTDLVIVTLSDPVSVFREPFLREVDRLCRRIERLNGVAKVTGLTTVTDMVGEDGNFIVERLIEAIPSDPAALARLRDRAVSNPLFAGSIVSEDGRTTAVVVEIRDRPGENGGYRHALVGEIEGILRTDVPPSIETHLGGKAGVEYHYSNFMRRDLMIFMPFILGLMSLVLLVTFRSFRLMVYPMAIVTLGLIYTLAFMRLLGYTFNNVMVIIPPIILAITVAGTIHYVAHVARDPGLDRPRVLLQTLRTLLTPCFLTSITTMLGFLSLLTSGSPAIRQLGLVAAGGVLLVFVATITLLPVMMTWGMGCGGASKTAPTREREIDLWVAPVVERIIVIVNRRGKTVLWASAGLALLCVCCATRIRAESSIIEQLDPGTDIYRATRFIEDNLTGTDCFSISLRHERPDGFYDPEALRFVETVQRFLDGLPGVDRTMSVLDYVKEMNSSFHGEDPAFLRIPETRRMVAQYALLYSGEALENYVDSSWSWTAVHGFLTEHSSAKQLALFDSIRSFLREHPHPGISAEVLGVTVWAAEGVETVTRGQISSLGFSMLAIFGMMLVCFRSFTVGLISTLPNVLPLLVNFGLMGLFNIKLDIATSIISAVAIGIMVDDTIHFMYGFGEAMERNGGDHAGAVADSLRSRGGAMVSTSVVLLLGFGILMFSRFMPVMRFGLLSAVLMVTALVADLVVNPCLLVWLKPRIRRMM